MQGLLLDISIMSMEIIKEKIKGYADIKTASLRENLMSPEIATQIKTSDFVVIDPFDGKDNDLKKIQQIKAISKAKVICYISDSSDNSLIESLIALKVDAILSKKDCFEDLSSYIERVIKGLFVSDFLDSAYIYSCKQKIKKENRENEKYILGSVFLKKLTKKELEVAELLGKGFRSKEIAKEMGISYNTVRNHLTSIRTKTNASSKTEIAIMFEAAA